MQNWPKNGGGAGSQGEFGDFFKQPFKRPPPGNSFGDHEFKDQFKKPFRRGEGIPGGADDWEKRALRRPLRKPPPAKFGFGRFRGTAGFLFDAWVDQAFPNVEGYKPNYASLGLTVQTNCGPNPIGLCNYTISNNGCNLASNVASGPMLAAATTWGAWYIGLGSNAIYGYKAAAWGTKTAQYMPPVTMFRLRSAPFADPLPRQKKWPREEKDPRTIPKVQPVTHTKKKPRLVPPDPPDGPPGHPRPPGPKVRERKVVGGLPPVLAKIVNMITEGCDFVEAAYWALPSENRNGGQWSCTLKAAAVLMNWNAIDVGKFINNLLLNAFQDGLIGKMSQAEQAEARRMFERGFQTGTGMMPSWGPMRALQDAMKGLGM